MREFKFRAWDGDRLRPINWWNFKLNEIITSKHTGDVSEFKVMQYTGLKDKNGVEIYEGDIVNITSNNHFVEVVFQDGTYYIKRKHIVPLRVMYKYLEVVGNIYQDKELLK